MRSQLHPQRRVVALAEVQHGTVGREQLVALGITPSSIDNRVADGRLHVRHRGVYAVGHRILTREGEFMAAVLARGRGAVLSHRSAAQLHGFRWTDAQVVDVSVAGRGTQRHAGIKAHRPRRLMDDETTVHLGIPVTTVARTLLDLGDLLDERQLARACDEAERQRAVDWAEVIGLVGRHPGKLGAKRLRRLLERHGVGEDRTRSDLERRFRAFCQAHRLRPPEVNAVVAGYEVDTCWPDARVIVELDGFAYHRTSLAFERDRRRDAALMALRWVVIRVTWARIEHDGPVLVSELRALGVR